MVLVRLRSSGLWWGYGCQCRFFGEILSYLVSWTWRICRRVVQSLQEGFLKTAAPRIYADSLVGSSIGLVCEEAVANNGIQPQDRPFLHLFSF